MNSAPLDLRTLKALLIALLLATTAVLLSTGFSLYQGFVDRGSLLATLGSQEQPLRQVEQVKTQLSALAQATAKLADQGNQHAKEVIEALKSQGITIRQ